MMEIMVDDICKIIRGKTILDHVSLNMTGGMIYGFVGTNGSGKTMLFRAVAGLMRVDSGRIVCNGQVLHRDIEILPDLGISLENAGLYPELSGMDNLKLLAGINHKINDEQIRNAILRVGLEPDNKKSFRKYSLGMKQRLVIAQAIMEEPKILILDEPTNALDSGGVDLVREIVMQEKEAGTLVMIASHNKEDIRLLADEIYYMSEGKISRGDAE